MQRYIGIAHKDFQEQLNDYFAGLYQGGGETLTVPLVPEGQNEESKITHYIFSWNMDWEDIINLYQFIQPTTSQTDRATGGMINIYNADNWTVKEILEFEQLEKYGNLQLT